MLVWYYCLIIIQIFSAVAGQVFLKKAGVYSFKELPFFIFLGSAGFFYVTAAFIYMFLLKTFALSKLGPVLALGTVSFVFICGIVFFGEVVKAQQIVGLLLGITAVVLIML